MPFVESFSSDASATGDRIIEEVIQQLLSGQREEMNKLSASIQAGDITLTFKYDMGAIRGGAQIDVDLEAMRVWSIDEQAHTAIVERAMQGTTAFVHSEDALVYVNPRMSRHAILKSLNDELRALSAPSNGLYVMKYVEFDYEGTRLDYDLADDVMTVYEVRIETGPTAEWLLLTEWKCNPSANATAFPSGQSIHIPMGIPGRKVRVLYKAAFKAINAPGDDIFEQAGMPPEMQDILAQGILIRLGLPREIKRNFTEAQGDARRASEVAPGSVGRSFAALREGYQNRIAYEAQRLAVRYPLRHR